MTSDELEMFKLAKTISQDYFSANEVLKSIEPENFVEKWLDRNYENITEEKERLVWKFFLENLKNKKKR